MSTVSQSTKCINNLRNNCQKEKNIEEEKRKKMKKKKKIYTFFYLRSFLNFLIKLKGILRDHVSVFFFFFRTDCFRKHI